MIRYTMEQVAEIAAEHLAHKEIARCVVACLRHPAAFEAPTEMTGAELARHFLKAANRVTNEGGTDGKRSVER